jgi:hypothetical protein
MDLALISNWQKKLNACGLISAIATYFAIVHAEFGKDAVSAAEPDMAH